MSLLSFLARLAPQSRNILDLLASGAVQITGQFVWGTNFTFLVDISIEDSQIQAIYKPVQGERPLWDFPRRSLARREVAAYLTSSVLGWDLIPPTIIRSDLPAGEGSLQQFIDYDPEHHYFEFSPAERQELRPAALFDLLINNADRKGGHIILTEDNTIKLIDHGVCFHQDPKLRTVIWDFCGEVIPVQLLQDISHLLQEIQREPLLKAYESLLSTSEIDALIERAKNLIAIAEFPNPANSYPYPFPLV